jgi:hypothetical protein
VSFAPAKPSCVSVRMATSRAAASSFKSVARLRARASQLSTPWLAGELRPEMPSANLRPACRRPSPKPVQNAGSIAAASDAWRQAAKVRQIGGAILRPDHERQLPHEFHFPPSHSAAPHPATPARPA